MISPRSFTESLLFATVRIETVNAANAVGSGTGFFFQVPVQGERFALLLVTNKHVVRNAVKGSLCLHLAKDPSEFAPSGKLYNLSLGDASGTFESAWTGHADPNIDLCAINVSPLLNHLASQGHHIFFQSLEEKFIYSKSQLEALMAVEEVIMVGYPIGLADTVHNLPLIRSGVTANHPAIDFQGKAEGVVDMACFPGSSGSPVFLYNQTMYYDKVLQTSTAGPRQAFLGVLFAGPQHDTEGKIVVRAIPTASHQAVPVTRTMIHLGYYVKAREVLALAREMVTKLGGV